MPTQEQQHETCSQIYQMCDQLRDQNATIELETNQKLQMLEQLRHADRLKTVGQLAAGFAHEVGTPLNVIIGRASMILEDKTIESNDRVKTNAREIKSEAERISSIVQKLLDYSRQNNSKKNIGDLRLVTNCTCCGLLPKKEILRLRSPCRTRQQE